MLVARSSRSKEGESGRELRRCRVSPCYGSCGVTLFPPVNLTVHVRNESEGTVLVLEGTFDVGEADSLDDALHGVAPERPVAIDFHQVRLFNDFAVPRLAQAIADSRGI